MKAETNEEDLRRLYERTMLDRKYLFNSLAELQLPKNARIIDIGCGSGGSTQIVRECYPEAEIFGVDNSAAAIEYASRLTENEIIKYINSDASHLPFPDNYFDCCVAKMILDIVASPEGILEEMVRILKPHGILLIYGNTKSTAQGTELLKNSDKLIKAYERYTRLTGWKGFNIEYLKEILLQKYKMTVSVQEIIKDTINPGREQLAGYYQMSEKEVEACAQNNVLVKLGLISSEEVIEYEISLNGLLTNSNEYLYFEQAIISAVKEEI